jgi:hypothetical protein
MPSLAEFDVLTTPTPATSPSAILAVDAVLFYTRIDPVTGAFPSQITSQYGLVMAQFGKQIDFVMRSGVARGDTDYIDRAFLAIEKVLSYRNPMELPDEDGNPKYYDRPDLADGGIGSFPALKFGSERNRKNFHDKVLCCERIANGLLVFRDSAWNTGDRATRYAAILEQLEEVADWSLATYEASAFMRKNLITNQVIRGASWYHKAGLLFSNSTFAAAAVTWLTSVFATRVKPDGSFVEAAQRSADQFDGWYQVQSLEMLAEMVLTLSDGAWKTTVQGVLRHGVERLLAASMFWPDGRGVTGELYTGFWCRCKEILSQKAREPGAFPATYDRDHIPHILHLAAYVLGDTGWMLPLTYLADIVIGHGQYLNSKEGADPGDDGENGFEPSADDPADEVLRGILDGQCVGWFDFEDLKFMTVTDGKIESMIDPMTGAVFQQAVSTKRPTLATSEFGRQVAVLDGDDDFLDNTDGHVPYGWPQTGAGGLFAVVSQERLASVLGANTIIQYGGTGTGSVRRLVRQTTGTANTASHSVGTSGGAVQAIVTNPPFDGWHFVHGWTDGTNTYLQIDDGAPVVVTATLSFTDLRARLFANTANTAANFWKGSASCIGVYTGTLDADRREALRVWALPRMSST